MKVFVFLVSIACALCAHVSSSQADERRLVPMPSMMQDHMLGNMRDHLLAIEEILQNLAAENYEEAAKISENRLGMSSLKSHGASHLAKVMPEEMAAIGTGMHRAASKFSLTVQDAEISGDHASIYNALQEILSQCTACHAAYKIK